MKQASHETKLINRLFLLLVIASVFEPFFLSRLFSEGGILENAGINQQTIISELLLFLMAAVFIAVWGREIFESVPLGAVGTNSVLWILALSFLVQPVMVWLNMITMSFAENHVAQSAVRASGSFVINLLYLAAVPALVEELIFRGLIYHGLRGLGVRKAVLLSALMFGLLHLNINQFAYAFLLGIILALTVEITGSLYSSMLLHFMINSRSVIYLSSEDMVNALLTENSSQVVVTPAQYLLSAAVYTPIALMCIAGVIWALYRMAKSCGRDSVFGTVQTEENTESLIQPGCSTPALWAGIILSVIFIIRFDLLY